MPNPKSPKRTVWLIALALIILALVPFAIHRVVQKNSEASSTSAVKNTTRADSGSPNSPVRRSRRTPLKNLPPTHKTEDLKNFHLPPTELHNVTLQEALATLFAQYRQICKESGESPISFHYEINGNPEPINFIILQGGFLSSCNCLAAIAGTTLEIADSELIFSEIEDGPVSQKRWTVPPTFQTFTERFTISEKQRRDHPFAEVSPPTSIKELFQSAGLMDEDDAVSFLKSSSTLIARAGAKTHSRIDGLVSAAASGFPIQTSLRFIDERDQLPFIALLPGTIGTVERSSSTPDRLPNYQISVHATERGFGREIQTISFTGEPPSGEARELYFETGNTADLGAIENLTTATYHISRTNEDEPQILTFKDEQGHLHERTFIAQRLDATGRVIPTPKFAEE